MSNVLSKSKKATRMAFTPRTAGMTASLAVLETLNMASKMSDDADRNAYKPRKILPTVAGTVEYRSCELEGWFPTSTEIATGLYEVGAYYDKLTTSGSSNMDHIVMRNSDGLPVARTATDVHAHAIIIMKAMKDTTFSGSDENNARKFEIWFAKLLSASNAFPFLLELIKNCRGHPYDAGETALWPYQYALEIYSELRRIMLQQPRYPYKVWVKNKQHIADGSAFTHFTDAEIATAAAATNMAKGAAGAASSNNGETVAQQNAAVAAVPATPPVSTAVATAMLKPHEHFEYSLKQKDASQKLYLETNKAFYNILVNTTKGNALAHVLTCKGDGFRAFQGLLKQNVETSVTFFMDSLEKLQKFRFSSTIHPGADAAAFVELCESLRESNKVKLDESMLIILFMQALPREAYKLLLKDFTDRLDEKGVNSLSIANMVISTKFFYETDVIKDNKNRQANSLMNNKEIKKMKTLNAAQQNWRAKGGNSTKKECSYCHKTGHTQDMCFANPDSSSYRPKGGSKHRSVNKLQLQSKVECTFCKKKGHTAKDCRLKIGTCNKCHKTGHLEANCTAQPCRTCGNYYYRSSNHRYHNCDGSAAQTQGALNNICKQVEHVDAGMTDISDDQYLPQAGNNEDEDDYHFGTDDRFLTFVATKRKGLNKDERMARDEADDDPSDEDRADEHAVNFIENTTEVPVQQVAAVHAELPATTVNHKMWDVDLHGPDHWKLIGYTSFEECEREFNERCGGFDTITGKPKFTARQIKLSLDKFPANYMSGATYNVDEFGISTSLKDYVKNVEKNISSK